MTPSAVVVMPRESTAWPTADALWITAKGWAAAAESHLGAAWIVTPDGVWRPDSFPRPDGEASSRLGTAPIPRVVRTLAKDLVLWRRQSRFEVPPDGPWNGSDLRLIWEHHDLFNRAGSHLARLTGAPVVRYVHAPQVWEGRKWGVSRPVWGRWIERIESRNLASADLVACVSEQVRARLHSMRVDPERTVVAPMGVDADLFHPEGSNARDRLGIRPEAVVVAWSGSFRRFHGLDRVLDAFAEICRRQSHYHLLLLGDGPERSSLEAMVAGSGLEKRVHFAGPIRHAEMPRYLRVADLAVVSSDARGGFHYSPLKLREYAACGLPVVAPNEGELVDLAEAGFVTLYPPGDIGGLARALVRIGSDSNLHISARAAARSYALRHWTWERQLKTVLDRLEDTAGRS